MLALDADAAARVGIPERADDVDRLLERLDRLAGRAARTAHRCDRVPESAAPEAQLQPPAGQKVQARRGAREHRGLAQRKVDDVAGQVHALGLGGDIGEQRPRVQERRLVGVVLEGDEIEPGLLG